MFIFAKSECLSTVKNTKGEGMQKGDISAHHVDSNFGSLNYASKQA